MDGRTNCGGGLKLHVVGGTTKPSSAAENTIWLNTSTTITDWSIQNTAPTAASGLVYITTRTVTSNTLDIGSGHSVKLYLGTARQYKSSAWTELTGEVYYNSAWHKLQTFVYDGTIGNATNNFNSQIGGRPWVAGPGGDPPTISTSTDHFSFNNANKSYENCWMYAPNKIDFTDIKTVKIIYNYSTTGNASTSFFVAANVSEGSILYPAAASSALSVSSSKPNVTINTTSLSGQYYLGLRNQRNTGYQYTDIYSIELIS